MRNQVPHDGRNQELREELERGLMQLDLSNSHFMTESQNGMNIDRSKSVQSQYFTQGNKDRIYHEMPQ